MSDTLPPQIVTNILDTFQANLDTFVIPLLTSHQILPLLGHEEQRVFAAVMHRLEPVDTPVKRHKPLPESHAHMVPPSNATPEQMRFVRVTPAVNLAFDAMVDHCRADTSNTLIIESGYRSHAYQALLLMGTYYRNNFDLNKTLREIQPPGFSEHQDHAKPAIDITASGMAMDDSAFASEVYPWLHEHAAKYGFVESYPRTQSAMIWEPWHWKLK